MPRTVGIDLGSYSVKVIHLEPKGRGTFEVLAYGEAFVPPASEGSDAAASLGERHSAALSELKQNGLLDGDIFVTGLPGDAAAVRMLRFPFRDAKKIAEALPFALESEIPLSLDEIALSWSILGPSARAKKDLTSETEVLVAWAKKEAVQGVLSLLAVHGIDPRHVEFDALALDDLYHGLFAKESREESDASTGLRTPGGTVIEMGAGAPEPATAVVDIGHRRTTVCVLAGERVVSAHTILHGGADATRALAKAINLPLVEAERGKRKEAFIEVVGARAQFPEQQQISEVLKTAYAPIVRRLRQIFQSTISTARLRVVKVVLLGGGSRVLNVDRHFAEELNVKVARGRALAQAMRAQLPIAHVSEGASEDGAPEAALAFAYALSAVAVSKTRARIDFRTGEFAWRGDFDFLREKAPALAAWAACLVLLLGGSGVARAYVLGSTERELVAQELALCAEITGQPNVDSFQRCLAMIQERINGKATFQVPERSAADTYLEIGARLPPASEFKRKITEMDITSERVKLKGLTSTYENVDKMVERLQGGRCFSLVEKGKAQNKGAEIEFNIAITLDCVAAPGQEVRVAAPELPAVTSTASERTSPAPADVERAPAAGRSTARGDSDRQGELVEAAAAAETSPPPVAPAPTAAAVESESEVAGAKLSTDDITARRERLKKLREERELRRANRGPDGLNPLATPRNPAIRERMLKGKTDSEGTED